MSTTTTKLKDVEHEEWQRRHWELETDHRVDDDIKNLRMRAIEAVSRDREVSVANIEDVLDLAGRLMQWVEGR